MREALRTLYGCADSKWSRIRQRFLPPSRRFHELILPIDRTIAAKRSGRRSQHGCYAQIPPAHLHKPVLCVTRHPMDQAVSAYEHGFWRDHPLGEVAEIQDQFPCFPDLSFPQFLEMWATFGFRAVLQDLPLRADVGTFTLHFIRFFFPDANAAITSLDDDTIESGEVLREMPDITFIHTERLVEELRGFLHSVGFQPEQTSFLLERSPVNQANSRRGRPWEEYFDEALATEFRHRERLLFKAFPEYDA